MAANSQLMPEKHRNILRGLIVLRGYSSIACGSGMKAIDQQKKIYEFLYDKLPNKPSQYYMLVEGVSDYQALFNHVAVKIVNKDGKPVEVDRLKFRTELIGDYSQPY